MVNIMTIHVVYHSDTGNTKKIADEIFQGIENDDKNLINIGEVDIDSIDGSELVFIGFPTIAGKPSASAAKFMGKLPTSVRRTALFCTHSGLKNMALKEAERNLSRRHIRVVGSFDCMGEASDKVRGLLGKFEDEWKGHPNEEDLINAREFGKEMSSGL